MVPRDATPADVKMSIRIITGALVLACMFAATIYRAAHALDAKAIYSNGADGDPCAQNWKIESNVSPAPWADVRFDNFYLQSATVMSSQYAGGSWFPRSGTQQIQTEQPITNQSLNFAFPDWSNQNQPCYQYVEIISQNGANGTYASDDFIGISFYANDWATSNRYLYQYGLSGASNTSVIRNRIALGPNGLTIAPYNLSQGTVGVAYNQTFTVVPSLAGQPFSVSSGGLPPGLVLSRQGVLSGTPSQAGVFSFTVVFGYGSGVARQNYDLVVTSPSPIVLPPAIVGAFYQAPTGSILSGQLLSGSPPPGMTYNPYRSLMGIPTTAGTFTFTISYGLGLGQALQAYTLTVNSATITIDPPALPSGTVGSAYQARITASGGLPPYNYSYDGALPSGLQFDTRSGNLFGTPTSAGSYDFAIDVFDSQSRVKVRRYSLVIGKVNQAALLLVASPETIDYNATSTLSLSGGSGTGTVSYAVTAGTSVCSLSGTTLTGIGVGICTVTVTKTGDSTYNEASASVDVTVGKSAQAALSASATPSSIVFGGTSALATSGGAGSGEVSYALVAGNAFCSISGSTLTATGTGTCTVQATKSGDADYGHATATVNVTVGKADQVALAVAASPNTINYGATSALSTSGGSGTGALTYAVTSGADVCSISGSALTGTGVGTCTVTTTKANDPNYNQASATITVTVNKATEAALVATALPETIDYQATSALSTSGGSGSGAVSFAVTSGSSVCSVSGTTLTGTGIGVCTVSATKLADAHYTQSTATVDVSVGKAPQATLSVSASPASIAFGGASHLATSGGSGTGSVTYAVIAGQQVCSISGATLTGTGVGTCQVRATKAGNIDYGHATALVSVAVGKATQAPLSISSSPATIAFNGTAQLATSGGSGGGAVTFAVTSGASNCTIAGSTLHSIGVGSCMITAIKAADADYFQAIANTTVTVAKAEQSGITAFASPEAIDFNGVAVLSSSGGSGTGAVTYAIVSGSSVCALSGATLTGIGTGLCKIKATKASDADYNASTTVVDVSVGKARQAALTASASPSTIDFGGISQLAASGGSGTGAVTYAVVAGQTFCSISGTSLKGTNPGTCRVRATKADDIDYGIATALVNVRVGRATQAPLAITATPSVITFNGTSQLATVGGSGGGAVTYAVTSGASFCSISGAVLRGIGIGSCLVTATKTGGADYDTVTANAQVTVKDIETSVSLSASAETVRQGEPVAFKATVSPAPTSGTVTFTVNGTPGSCGAVDLTHGVATCSMRFTTPGVQLVVARYAGAVGYSASHSNTSTVSVDNSVRRTVNAIGKFMGQRANAIMTNQFDGSRQIDRLMEADQAGISSNGGTQQTGFASRSRLGPPGASTSRVGDGLTSGDMTAMRMGATGSGRYASPVLGGMLGRRSDDMGWLSDNQSAGQSEGSTSFSLGGPANVTGSFVGDLKFSFSSSLRQALRFGQQRQRQKRDATMESLGFGADAAVDQRPVFMAYDLWIEGKYGEFTGTGREDGHFGLVTIGADYVFNRSFIAGVFIQYDTMGQTGDNGSKVNGNGWMAGPYATLRLSENLFWQSRVAWGRSSNNVSPYGTYSDSFDTTRWLASTALVGRYQYDNWTISPEATLTYFEDKSGSFSDSFGMPIPGVKTSLGQFKTGPSISYSYVVREDLRIEPRLAAQLIWNFDNSTHAAGFGNLGDEAVGPTGARGRIEGGLRAQAASGTSLDLSASYDGIGASGYSAMTGRAALNIPFN